MCVGAGGSAVGQMKAPPAGPRGRNPQGEAKASPISPKTVKLLHRFLWSRFLRPLAPCTCRSRRKVTHHHAVDCPRYWPAIW